MRLIPALTTTLLLGLVAARCACPAQPGPSDGGPDGGPDGAVILPDGGYAYSDFPSLPVLDMSDGGGPALPLNAPDLFDAGSVGPGAGPCLIEPQVGTLFPQNWIRPRFTMVPVSGQNIFELRLHADHELHDLVVYSRVPQWTLPPELWAQLAQHVVNQPITMTVRAGTESGGALISGPSLGTSGPFVIAPVSAGGTIVYWTPSGATSLQGFAVGDESVGTVLTPSLAGTQCIGCHASTPDGLFVGFSASPVPGDGTPASVNILSLDGGASPLPFITSSAQSLLNRPLQQLPHFTRGHWAAGDHIALSMLSVNGSWEIIWTDLEATAQAQGTGWGILSRTGDTQEASYASFDHSGERVLYVSATGVGSGTNANNGIVRIVPWNQRAGGTSQALLGASDATYNQYYPVFSPDDTLVAFDRVPTGQSSYNDAAAELYVVSADGGTPVRLAANDPPACTGVTSPGITNSWPRWAPTATTANGRTYYWLTFSSSSVSSLRTTANGSPQLYITAVVVDASGITTYPALYLWNQPADQHNHTPAWDVFQIPFQ